MGLYDGKFLCDLTLAEEERVQSRLTLVVDSNSSQVRDTCIRGGGLVHTTMLSDVSNPPHPRQIHPQICSLQKSGGPAMSQEQLATALTLCGARLKQVAQAQAQQQEGGQGGKG